MRQKLALPPARAGLNRRVTPLDAHANGIRRFRWCHRLEWRRQALKGAQIAARFHAAAALNFTDTRRETPGSCMVTPYSACAASMVRLE